MIIEKASTSDVDGINRLLHQVLNVHHKGRPDIFQSYAKKYTDEELQELLKDTDRPIFVARNDCNEVLGYAFCIIQQPKQNNILTPIKTLYIDDLCVDEGVRGAHIGTQLYDYVTNYAREQGCYNLTLNVWSCNEHAIKFYESRGLQPQKIGMEMIL